MRLFLDKILMLPSPNGILSSFLFYFKLQSISYGDMEVIREFLGVVDRFIKLQYLDNA